VSIRGVQFCACMDMKDSETRDNRRIDLKICIFDIAANPHFFGFTQEYKPKNAEARA
jgi:hypothetical protein